MSPHFDFKAGNQESRKTFSFAPYPPGFVASCLTQTISCRIRGESPAGYYTCAMKLPRLLLSLLLACAAVTATAQTPSSSSRAAAPAFTRTEDVVYGRKFGVALTLDVIQPTKIPNGYAIITLVSGGWKSGHE